jgi:hypothetical protein
MISKKDSVSQRRPLKETTASKKEAQRPARTSCERAVAGGPGVELAPRPAPEQESPEAPTLQKMITKHTSQDQPEPYGEEWGKGTGTYSVAIAREQAKKAGSTATRRDKRWPRAGAGKQGRQKAQDEARKGKPDEAKGLKGTLDGWKKHQEDAGLSDKLQTEPGKVIPETRSEPSLEMSQETFAKGPENHKQSPKALKDKVPRYTLQRGKRVRGSVDTNREGFTRWLYKHPTPFAASPQSAAAGLETGTAQNRKLHQLIHVRYQNSIEGPVDDVTLEELIESKRISHFYRPSEDRWVDILVDPVRSKRQIRVTEHLQRASDWEEEEKVEQEPRGFFSRLFKRSRKRIVPGKHMSAREWFDKGFVMVHTSDDCEGAIRAFALSIQLNSTYERAYVNRALAYERLGNLQQATEDYSRALTLNPGDGKVYYLRGLAFRRLNMNAEAVADLEKASDLRYRPAYNLLKSTSICA